MNEPDLAQHFYKLWEGERRWRENLQELRRLDHKAIAESSREDLQAPKRDAVALVLAMHREDWESIRQIVAPYGTNWVPLAKALLSTALLRRRRS